MVGRKRAGNPGNLLAVKLCAEHSPASSQKSCESNATEGHNNVSVIGVENENQSSEKFKSIWKKSLTQEFIVPHFRIEL